MVMVVVQELVLKIIMQILFIFNESDASIKEDTTTIRIYKNMDSGYGSIDSTCIISAILYDINDDSDDNMEHESFITCNLKHISIYWYYLSSYGENGSSIIGISSKYAFDYITYFSFKYFYI